MGLGFALFLAFPLLAALHADPQQGWSIDDAVAGEVIATRAVEVTSPPGPAAENAIVAAAQLRPSGVPLQAQRSSDLAILGLTFSLLLAGNLAFWRHLRRESASSVRRSATPRKL
jgi:hypothetical protein